MKKEILYADFVKMVKAKGKVRASLSHSQSYPDGINQFAILDFQIDSEGTLFTVTKNGRRAEVNPMMPAFKLSE